jgi:hypothetical protein
MRSETSVTVAPKSGFPFSVGKALEDRGQQQSADKGRPDNELGMLGGGAGRL